LIYLVFMARTKKAYLEGLVKEKPEDSVLDCISSAEARAYQILPVSISEFSGSLYVVARVNRTGLEMKSARETFGRIVNIEGYVRPEKWDGAYELFYGESFNRKPFMRSVRRNRGY